MATALPLTFLQVIFCSMWVSSLHTSHPVSSGENQTSQTRRIAMCNTDPPGSGHGAFARTSSWGQSHPCVAAAPGDQPRILENWVDAATYRWMESEKPETLHGAPQPRNVPKSGRNKQNLPNGVNGQHKAKKTPVVCEAENNTGWRFGDRVKVWGAVPLNQPTWVASGNKMCR